MKITTLIENTRYEQATSVKPEHGLSFFVKTNAHRFLLDVGAGELFASNAKQLNISIQDVDFAVISHAHFDHGGGLKTFLEENARAPIYLQTSAFGDYYGKLFGFIKKHIGLDKSLLQQFRQRFVFVQDFVEIVDNVFIIPDISDDHPKPSGNAKLLKKLDGKYVPDDFEHELVLVVRETDGLVVFTGCSHSGILNMVETVESRFEGEKIKAILGGFHLMNPITKKMTEEKDQVIRIGQALYDKAHVTKVFSGHCTGKIAYDLLKSQMKEKLEYFSTGSIISI
ncbi:MAG: MBL fold metallo-hydrolase [Chloroflexi bacterium]|nr:MBL fold metallo-hydrolase [Chloroflexota bacterium]